MEQINTVCFFSMLLKSLFTLFHFILGVNGAKYQDVFRKKTKILTPEKIRKPPVYTILNETASKISRQVAINTQ